MEKYSRQGRKILLELFLREKKLAFEQCNKRQKEILTKEDPNIWYLYQWDLKIK